MSDRSDLARRLSTELAFTPSAFLVPAGLWIALAPLLVGDRFDYPWWNDVAAGLLIAALAVARVLRPAGTGALNAVHAVLGAWLIAAPFLLGFADQVAVTWNNIVVGFLVILLGTASALPDRSQARRTTPSRSIR